MRLIIDCVYILKCISGRSDEKSCHSDFQWANERTDLKASVHLCKCAYFGSLIDNSLSR